MFKPLTVVAVGLSLALSGAALAKEKIDFMFPAPVDGKLTMEMTRVIKQFNDSQQDVEVRGIFTGNYDTTKIKAESAQKAGQPPALVIMSANFTTDLALKMRSCRWMSCLNMAIKRPAIFCKRNSGPRCIRTPR